MIKRLTLFESLKVNEFSRIRIHDEGEVSEWYDVGEAIADIHNACEVDSRLVEIEALSPNSKFRFFEPGFELHYDGQKLDPNKLEVHEGRNVFSFESRIDAARNFIDCLYMLMNRHQSKKGAQP